MSHDVPAAPDPPPGSTVLSPAEQLVCEWEARHDVAARSRQVDPGAALRRYLTHSRVEEEVRHQDASAHGSTSPPVRHAEPPEEFAAEHPLAASWLRWGEDARWPAARDRARRAPLPRPRR